MKKNQLKKYLIQIQKENKEPIKNFNISIEGSVCDTNSKFKDVVSFYILNENGLIKEISVKCGPCDPYAYIVSNILSKILKGLKIEQIRITNDMIYQEFLKSLDYKIDEDMRFHFETLLKILEDKLNNKV
ncbi:MAG: hypothetical protein ABIN35_06525 [candidate division WOR-3 bacterium]